MSTEPACLPRQSAAGKVPYPVAQLNIGKADNYFQGSIDQVRLYNRALSTSDIALLASGWKSATVSAPSASLAGWSYSLPTGLEGLYALKLRGTDAYSNTASSDTVWRGMIDMRAPQITLRTAYRGGGYAAATTYTITATDTFINAGALVTPCAGQNPTITYGYHANLGSINRLVVTCEIAGFTSGTVTATAVDYAGNTKTATATLGTPTSQPGILIMSPSGTITGTTAISVTGGAYAPLGIQKITLSANSATVATLNYGAGTTDIQWATTWIPQASGAYTLTAVMTAQGGGVYTDTATVTVVPGYQLAVTRAGSGTGTITSSPSGISCGTDCSEMYAASTVVTLTASPGGNSTFTGWSGACSGNSACAVTMDQTRSVTATFALVTYSLGVSFPGNGDGTVTITPPGISCTKMTPGCVVGINAGTVVTLTAAPAAGSTFTGWGGSCSGTGGCVVTMSQAQSVSATFAISSVTPTATATVATPTATVPTPTATATVPTATATATATATQTATATVPTATATATATATQTATATVPTATATATATAIQTATATVLTATATATATAIQTATATLPTTTATGTMPTATTTIPTATATTQPHHYRVFIPLVIR
jgi:hypothetical protein